MQLKGVDLMLIKVNQVFMKKWPRCLTNHLAIKLNYLLF